MAEKPGRIPAGELTAYERWELPNLQGSGQAHGSARAASASRGIKPLTAADIEEIRQQAYQAGFDEGKAAGHKAGREEGFPIGQQEGHAQGLQQGLAKGKQTIDDNIEQLKRLMSSLLDPIAEHQQIIEQAVLNIALAVSRSVIYRELKQDSSSICKALSDIFHNLPKLDRQLSIRLNPVDREYVQQAVQSFSIEAELLSDPAVSAGGCIVETSSQVINYTVEKRFQKTVHAMLMKAAQSDAQRRISETDTTISERSDYPAELLEEVEAQAPTPAAKDKNHEAEPEQELESEPASPKKASRTREPATKKKGADDAE